MRAAHVLSGEMFLVQATANKDLGVAVAGCGLWVVGCGLWVVGCGLWVAGCGLWVAGCGLRVVGCGLWVVGCGLWVVGCGKSPLPSSQPTTRNGYTAESLRHYLSSDEEKPRRVAAPVFVAPGGATRESSPGCNPGFARMVARTPAEVERKPPPPWCWPEWMSRHLTPGRIDAPDKATFFPPRPGFGDHSHGPRVAPGATFQCRPSRGCQDGCRHPPPTEVFLRRCLARPLGTGFNALRRLLCATGGRMGFPAFRLPPCLLSLHPPPTTYPTRRSSAGCSR